MKIVALTTFRDHRGSFRRGMPGDVPAAFAKELIAAKLAKAVFDEDEKAEPKSSDKKKSAD
ncbi:hypothetical protein [Rhizobium sp. Root483D2]|uniref:hypothetical protein n=1 Tax=Rhizobium sp. Root483D2 TaxID=1736545 RepID=UPI000B14C922|nr:hypothetical protein [Rhizobium sp. Root483D2]